MKEKPPVKRPAKLPVYCLPEETPKSSIRRRAIMRMKGEQRKAACFRMSPLGLLLIWLASIPCIGIPFGFYLAYWAIIDCGYDFQEAVKCVFTSAF